MLHADDWCWLWFGLQRAHRAPAIRRWDRLQLRSLTDQSFGRDRAGGAVNATVRYLTEPALDCQVGCLTIDDQAFLGQSARQRNPEALAQITDEPLHFALGLRPIRRAQPRPETTMPAKSRNPG